MYLTYDELKFQWEIVTKQVVSTDKTLWLASRLYIFPATLFPKVVWDNEAFFIDKVIKIYGNCKLSVDKRLEAHFQRTKYK